MQAVVIDTNLVVSALINPAGTPARVFGLIEAGEVELLVHEALLAEYEEVLKRAKFGFDVSLVEGMVSFLRTKGRHVVALPQNLLASDPDDQIFLDVALSNRAVLVTGNIKHYPAAESICNAADFIGRLLTGDGSVAKDDG